MASIEKRSNGSYRIAVSTGYDTKGKKLRKYKTITLPDDMTDRQREKELSRQAVLFEEQVRTGQYLDGEKVTLGEFAEKWLTEYVEKQLAPATVVVHKTRVEKRIIPALGHIKISKLQPHHIIEFYNMLAEDGMRLDVVYTPTVDLLSKLPPKGARGISFGVSRHTLNKIKAGNPTNEETAIKICKH